MAVPAFFANSSNGHEQGSGGAAPSKLNPEVEQGTEACIDDVLLAINYSLKSCSNGHCNCTITALISTSYCTCIIMSAKRPVKLHLHLITYYNDCRHKQ